MDTDAVSEIVGAIMLVMISISIFSVIYVTAPNEIYSIFGNERNNTDVIGYNNGDKVVLAHGGGESWSSWSVSCSNGYKATGAGFTMGDRIVIPLNETIDVNLVDNFGDLQFSGRFAPVTTQEEEEPPVIPPDTDPTVAFNGVLAYGGTGYECIEDNDGDDAFFYTKDHYDFYDAAISYPINTTGVANVTVVLRNTYDWPGAEWIVKLCSNGTEYTTGVMTGLTTDYKAFSFEFPTTVLKDVTVRVFINAKFHRNEIRITQVKFEVV